MADITKLRGDLAKAENIYGKMPDGAGKSAVEKKIALLKSQIADLESEAPKAEPKKKSAPAPKKKSGKETRHVFVKQVDGGKEVKVVMAKSREEAEEAMSGQGFEYDKEITRGRSPKEGFIADVQKGKRGRKKAEKAPAKRASKSERESLAQSAGMTSERAEKESERVTGAKKRGRKPMDKTGYLYEMPLKTQAGKVKRKVIKATSKASADVKAGKNYTFVRELSAGESPKVGVQPVEGYVKPEPKKRGRKPKAQSEVAPRVAKRVSKKSEAIGEGVAIADKAMTGNLEGVLEALETLNGEIGKMQREVARIQGEVTKVMSGKKMARGGGVKKKMEEGGTTDDKPKVESLTEVFMLMDGTEIAYEDMGDAKKMFGGDPLTPQELVDKLAVGHDIYVMDAAPELFDLPDGDDEDDDEFYTGNVKDGVTIDDIEDAIEDQLEADNSYNYSAPFVFDVRFTKVSDSYDPTIMIVREHRGGDVRGNYGPAMAFNLEDMESNPFYGEVYLEIRTNEGDISLRAESLESYNFYVNSDETGTFEEDDVISRDEIEEALDFGKVKSETLYIND
jgi:hypothetical protein